MVRLISSTTKIIWNLNIQYNKSVLVVKNCFSRFAVLHKDILLSSLELTYCVGTIFQSWEMSMLENHI